MNFKLLGISRHWGPRTALKDINLSINKKERVALIGPSGSGKTTLLKIMGGALAPSAGRILVNDQVISEMSARQIQAHRSRLGIINQGGGLVPQLSVHRNVTAGLLPHWPWYKTAISSLWSLEKERAQDILGLLGIQDRQWDQTSTLSGGEQQRVALARALIAQPEVILADEPVTGLDKSSATSVVQLMLSQREKESTIIMSTHWVDLARGHLDRLIGIREGQVVFDKSSNKVTDADLAALYEGSRERR
jgi:phosphonate transport system ATP-binding protein